MDLRAVIVKLAFRIFAKPEHARQRRQPDSFGRLVLRVGGAHLRFLAKEKHRHNVHYGCFARSDDQFIRPDATHAIEDGVEMQLIVRTLRLAQPPVSEQREFFRAISFSAINGQPSR